MVPADELDATVADLARRLADGPTRAHAVNKWLLNRSLDVDRATMAQEESWIVDVMAQSLDSDEGVSSFMEKRAAELPRLLIGSVQPIAPDSRSLATSSVEKSELAEDGVGVDPGVRVRGRRASPPCG